MFSILRFILIVGVIFYYSPVRQKDEAPIPSGVLRPEGDEQAAPRRRPRRRGLGHLETMWQALPDTAKQAVVEKILTTSGLTPASSKATDTLQPEDRQTARASSRAS